MNERLLARPWFAGTIFHLSIMPPIIMMLSFLGARLEISRWKGWSGLLEQWLPLVLAYAIGAFYTRDHFVFVFSVKHGYWMKALAVFHAVCALVLTRIVLEPATLSAWSPGIEAWAAWLAIGFFWIIAVIAYLTGDAMMRERNTQPAS